MSALRSLTAATLCLAGFVTSAHATAIFAVGAGGTAAGCGYATLQQAVDAERAYAGSNDIIYVSKPPSPQTDYPGQAIYIHDQSLTIIGGVDNCNDYTPSGATTLSGFGGAAVSVISVRGTTTLRLSHLYITQGDETGDTVGGGIDFQGQGTVYIDNSRIYNNKAGYGAGINFNGTGSGAELYIENETLISNNTATTSGGGIRMEGNSYLRIVQPQVWIANNHADGGYGGGIQVIGPAQADLGSPGYRYAEYLGLMYQNTAKYGGGLAINGGSSGGDANVCLFTTDPQHPVTIEGNAASQDGGGIYLKPVAGNAGLVDLAGTDYRVTTNSAQEGSAIYAGNDFATVTYDQGSNIRLVRGGIDCPPTGLGAVACTSDKCNSIDGNVAQNISGQATSGSTILVQANSELRMNPVRVLDNGSAHALRVISGYSSGNVDYTSTAILENCLIADNVTASDLVLIGTRTYESFDNCTIAGNAIGAGSVAINAAGSLRLRENIFAQGQTASLYYTGSPANLVIDYALAQETASLASGSHVVQGNPSFVNAGSGDYHLLPTSLAIDRAPLESGDDRDLDNKPHDVDIIGVPNADGARDLGAYERQIRYCGAADTLFCDTFGYD